MDKFAEIDKQTNENVDTGGFNWCGGSRKDIAVD